MCEWMHRIEDIFTRGQVKLNLGIPDSELQSSEEQKRTVSQDYVVGGPVRMLPISGRANSLLIQARSTYRTRHSFASHRASVRLSSRDCAEVIKPSKRALYAMSCHQILPSFNVHANCSHLNYDVEKSRRGSEFLRTSTCPEQGNDHRESCLDDLEFLLLLIIACAACVSIS